jgi:hypothetical protein
MHMCNVKEVEQYLVRGRQLEAHLGLSHTSPRYSDMRPVMSQARDITLGNSLLKHVPTGTVFPEVLHIPEDNKISRREGTLLCGFLKIMSPLRLMAIGRFCASPGSNMRDIPWRLDFHEEIFPTDRSNIPLEQLLFIPLLQTKRTFSFPHNSLDTHSV